jgi:hypothetical protein
MKPFRAKQKFIIMKKTLKLLKEASEIIKELIRQVGEIIIALIGVLHPIL